VTNLAEKAVASAPCYVSHVLRWWVYVGTVCLATGCSRPLELGTDVIWSTDFESGDLSAWSAAPGTGGSYLSFTDAGADAGALNPSITLSTEQHHSGDHSLKIASLASIPDPGPLPAGGGGVYKEGLFPENAYYSAWYYVPRPYVTTTNWNILRFRGVVDADAGVDGGLSNLLDLNLISQGDGSMTLSLTDARHQYLTLGLPDPVPIVPIGRWFQIECFYRNTTDPTGRLTIWLDGVQIYDIVRPTGPSAAVYFTPCSLVYEMVPTDAELYVDDVAISFSRVTPGGVFVVPR
jgi:hypothetical protein